MTRENQRVAITKRLLKENLLCLLEEKKIDEISITELCEKAEINRATFYRHYNVPRDLLTDIEKDCLNAFRDQGKNDVYESREELETALTQFCVFVFQNRKLVKTLIRNDSTDSFVDMFSGFFQTYLWVRNNGSAGHLAEDDIVLAAAHLSGSGFHMIRRWLMDEMSKAPEDIAALMLGITNFDFLFHWAEAGQGTP